MFEREKYPLKLRLLAGIGLAVIAAIYTVSIPIVNAGPPAASENPTENNALSGAMLYAINCSRHGGPVVKP